MWLMYPFDLKNAGATHAEMLPLKNNDAGECVCLLWWCDDKSRVACKSAPSLFFLSVLSFLFSFSFLQCFWPCPFFFLQGPMLSWKSYNLNRFAKPSRCHPFNSFLQQPGVIICIFVILFATCGSTPLKKWSWWRNYFANLLIPKTIGNRKRDCAWGGSGW